MIRRIALACALLGLVAVVGGVLALRHHDPFARARAAPTADIGTVPDVAPAGTPDRTAAAPPRRLELPRFGVTAPVVAVALRGRVMQVPRNPRVVGLWRAGAAPGSGHGSVVVVGHVNYAGTAGAFAVLPRTRPGDAVSLGRYRYRIEAVRTYPKSVGLPDAAFAHGGAERLVLITCGGDFDPATGNYVDNVVAYAVPVG